MKAKQILASGLVLLCGFCARSQGTLTFIYDQQSATATTPTEGGVSDLQAAQPFGQSFIPSLSAVGFVQLFWYDSSLAHNQGATIFLNLRANSINGPVLGQSDPMVLSANSSGFPDFIFSTPVSVTPGTTYYFQPVLSSGNAGIAGEFVLNYPGGAEIFQGTPAGDGRDLWFREGILVPEPSVWSLLLVCGSALAFRWRRR